ncbi:IS200/IS605 family transposase [Planctomycetota bacterium]
MRDWTTQSHVKWYCRYHVVWIPKYRKKVIFGKLRQRIGKILRALCEQYEIEVIEGHLRPDHVHMLVSIPPKYSVANAIGKLKGKSAIKIRRELLRVRKVAGLHFWARGYCVSTVGLDEKTVRDYIRHQETEEKKQLDLFGPEPEKRL